MSVRIYWGGSGGSRPLPFLLAWSLLVALVFLTSGAESKQYLLKANDKEILDFLLHKANYDRRIRPYESENSTLNVNVSVLLLSLSSPDESSLKYEVEFLLHTRWVDPRLKHDDGNRYQYLSGMHHLDDMWLPDIIFFKQGDFKEPNGPNHVALKIYRNGTVVYTRRRHLILSCKGDLNLFPFDDPYCQFSMESISYEASDIIFNWRNDKKFLDKSSSLRELNAYIICNETNNCDVKTRDSWRGFAGNYSCLQVIMEFSRDDDFYFSTVFIPGIILVTSSFITFWLEWNAVPARVMIGVTTMLNFFTTSNSFRATLPVVSNLAAMNLWDSVCMFFIYVSLLEFVLVNYVGRKRPKHNMAYLPGENNTVIRVLSENRKRIPQAIQRIGVSLRRCLTERSRAEDTAESGDPLGMVGEITGDTVTAGINSHDVNSTCGHCGNSQCSQTNPHVVRSNGEESGEMTQVEYTFNNKHRNKDPTHPIRKAKSIDVLSRIVFPLGYFIFLIYFFWTYKGIFSDKNSTKTSDTTKTL